MDPNLKSLDPDLSAMHPDLTSYSGRVIYSVRVIYSASVSPRRFFTLRNKNRQILYQNGTPTK